MKIRETPALFNQPRADFNKADVDSFVYQKGYIVTIEKAIKCACKGRNTDNLTTCKNCGSTGWVFINPMQTRIVLHSMNSNTQFKDWSEVNIGTASATIFNEDSVALMDKITLEESQSTLSENLPYKKQDEVIFFSTVYNIESIDYIALFNGPTNKFIVLKENEDYTIERNFIFLNSKYYVSLTDIQREDILSITIRYKYKTQYHVIDISREVFASNIMQGGIEKEGVDLPIHAIIRRTHYVLDAENLTKSRLLDNSTE